MRDHEIHISRQGLWHIRLQRIIRLDRRLSMAVALPDNPQTSHWTEYWWTRAATHLGDSWVWWLVAWMLWRRGRPSGLAVDGRTVDWRTVDGLHAQPTWLTPGRATLFGWLLSMFVTTGLVMAIKHSIRRPRPDSDTLLYGGGPDQHSFPSGHAARMGVLAVWGWQYGGGAGWLVSALAFIVSWSRVRLRIHYLGDVTVGLVLGMAMGLAGLVWRRVLYPSPRGRRR